MEKYIDDIKQHRLYNRSTLLNNEKLAGDTGWNSGVLNFKNIWENIYEAQVNLYSLRYVNQALLWTRTQ
jgi:hypothetical protein